MSIFDSVFSSGSTPLMFFLCLVVALITGILFSFLCYYKTESSKSFFITTALLPMTVCMVIMLVNGNIGTGVAIAGAFSLVRFRSAQGKAKEICIIFVSMATGLAFGMGYLFYGCAFAIFSGLILLLFTVTKVFEKKVKFEEKKLTITIPEDLDYTAVFEDTMKKYTSNYSLLKVKSTNMGSMFRLTYEITLKDVLLEKDFVDELRTQNGNLEITIQRKDYEVANL